MFIRKSKHDAIVAEKDYENLCLSGRLASQALVIEAIQQERAEARDGRDIAYRHCARLQSEVEQLTRDIAGLLPDAEAHRARKARQTRNLKQFRGGAGVPTETPYLTAAA